MKADIIIPQWNNADYTVACLESIKRHTSDYRIILIENGSRIEEKQKTLDAIRSMPHVLIENAKNLGFVKGVNQGIATSTAPFVVLQNNDTIVEEGWLDKMFQVFDENPSAGLVGPTTKWADSWQNRDRIKWPQPWPSYRKIHSMLAFFCTVIKRDVIQKVGYLSEEFGMGFGDDDDYCERAKAAGFDLFIRLDVTVKHHHRTTFKSQVPDWQNQQRKNIEKIKKKYPGILSKPKT